MKPLGGIIKITTSQGKNINRIWLTQGTDREDDWPNQKWDFAGRDEKGNQFNVQIELVFSKEMNDIYILRDGIYDEAPEM